MFGKVNTLIQFLSRPSGWRATTARHGMMKEYENFYPRPPGGGRPVSRCEAVRSRLQNFYPRPPGGGRQPGVFSFSRDGEISIHALRVEGDYLVVVTPVPKTISIHALRVKGRPLCGTTTTCGLLFLSTPSGWRATLMVHVRRSRRHDFYPRPPGGGAT